MITRPVRDGWAGAVGRPDRSVRRTLARVLPGLAVTIALVVAVWVLWPRTEPATSGAAANPTPAVGPGTPTPGGATTGSPTSTSGSTAVATVPPATAPGGGGTGTPATPKANTSVAEFARTQGFVLLAPRVLPAQWRNDGAEVVSGASTPEGCDQVGLYWLDPVDADFGFLDLYQFPVACAAARPDTAEMFTAGMHTGWIAPDARAGWRIELVAGPTLVQAYSDLLPEDLRLLLSDLVPFEPAVSPEYTFNLSPR